MKKLMLLVLAGIVLESCAPNKEDSERRRRAKPINDTGFASIEVLNEQIIGVSKATIAGNYKEITISVVKVYNDTVLVAATEDGISTSVIGGRRVYMQRK